MTMIRSTNPHDPTKVVHEGAMISLDDAARMCTAATAAARSWAATPAGARQVALTAVATDLEQHTDDLAALICDEVGKPIQEARGEVARAVALTRYYAQLSLLPQGDDLPAASPGSWLLTRRVPRGVVLAVTPWNFPLAIPAWKALPALAYGNAVILKPSSEAIGCAARFVEIMGRHLPANLCQLALGGGELVRALVGSEEVDALTFTGSTPVGRSLATRAAERGLPAQCEMGGQNASVVLADADLERSASAVAYAAMGYAGQKCTATRRVIVDRSVSDRFVPLLLDAVRAMGTGAPSDNDVLVGPMISDGARKEALEAVAASSGQVLLGGNAVEDVVGFHMEPTVVRLTDRSDVLAREEVFGPVLAVLEVDGEEEALSLANATQYGLAAAVFTTSLARATRFADGLEAGLIKVNSSTAGVDYHAPFGGVGSSSFGPREQGLAAVEFFTELKTIAITP